MYLLKVIINEKYKSIKTIHTDSVGETSSSEQTSSISHSISLKHELITQQLSITMTTNLKETEGRFL